MTKLLIAALMLALSCALFLGCVGALGTAGFRGRVLAGLLSVGCLMCVRAEWSK